MADISQVKLPSGNIYDIKDANLTFQVENILEDGVGKGRGPGDYTVPVLTLLRNRLVIVDPEDYPQDSSITVTNNVCTMVGSLFSGSFTSLENTNITDGIAPTGQIIYLYIGNINSLADFSRVTLTVNSKKYDGTSGGTISASLYKSGHLVTKADLNSNTVYPVVQIDSHWHIAGGSMSAQLSSLIQRVQTLQDGMVQGVQYAGVLAAASTASMSDGSTVSTLTRKDGTTLTFDDGTSGSTDPSDNVYGPGAIVISPDGSGKSTEYIWNGTKWQLLGSNTDQFGDFAYANTGTASISPGGTVSKPTFSGTPTTITVNGKAANGTASAQTFTGTNATITVKGNKPQQNVNLSISTSSSNNYTPQGTISFDSAVTTASTTITEITGRGTLPSRTASTVVTGVSGGKLVSGLSTTNIGKVTGIGSLPTTADKTVVTHTDFGNGYLISGSSTASIPKLTGLGTLPAATSGSVNQVSGLTQQSVSTAKITYVTAISATGGAVTNLTGLGSLISTESKTFVTGGTGVSGVGSLISTESKTFVTGLATNTTVGSIVTTASKTSAWASVDGETLVLSGSLLNGISTHAFPTLNTGTVRGVSGRGSLISTVALGTSTVRGVSGRGSLPTTASKSFITDVEVAPTGGFTSSTVVTSITPAHIVSTSSQNVLTNFATGTLPSTTSQSVVTAITAGSTPASTEENIKVLTGVGALPSCASQQVVTSISTANISVSTAQNYSMTGTGALPTTKSTTITYVSNASGNATFTGKPVTISGTVPAATITSTGTYKPAGSNSTSSVSIPAHTSTVAYTPAGTVSQPTFTPATATVTVYPV